jgi:hypothetical protein
MEYADYSSLVDTALVIGLALTVWVAYRELRRSKRADGQSTSMSNSPVA